MSVILFLLIRVSHVLLSALWIGAAVFVLFILTPAIAQSGPAGGQVMTAVSRRGLTRFMAIVAGTTVVSGIWLYWRFTGGFDPTVSSSRTGMVFGIGGAAGIIAAIVGGAIVGRSANELAASASRAAGITDGRERAALLQRMAALQGRMVTGTKIVVALQTVALALMAIGHYI